MHLTDVLVCSFYTADEYYRAHAEALRGLGVSGYMGTPSFLKLIVDKADELKIDITCLKRAQVGQGQTIVR